MRRLLPILLFSFLAKFGHSQIVDWRVDKYLEDEKLDTFLVYSFPCSGCIPFDSCQADEPHYLFWKRNGIFYLKRFDYCNTFNAIILDTSNPLTFYLKNRQRIDEDEIKQPTYYEVKRRKKRIDTLVTTSSVSHSSYHKFQLPFAKKPKVKYADIYDLDFKAFDNGRQNVFYSDNQKTKLKALIDQTTTLIKELKAKGQFLSE